MYLGLTWSYSCYMLFILLHIIQIVKMPHCMAYSIVLYSYKECGDSVVECLIQDRGVAGSSIIGSTALCP